MNSLTKALALMVPGLPFLGAIFANKIVSQGSSPGG